MDKRNLYSYSFIFALWVLISLVLLIPILMVKNSNAAASLALAMQRKAPVVSLRVTEAPPVAVQVILPTSAVVSAPLAPKKLAYRAYTVRLGDKLSKLDETGWTTTCRINKQLGRGGVAADCKLMAGTNIVLPVAVVESLASSDQGKSEGIHLTQMVHTRYDGVPDNIRLI